MDSYCSTELRTTPLTDRDYIQSAVVMATDSVFMIYFIAH